MSIDYLQAARSRLSNYVSDGGYLDGPDNVAHAAEYCKIEALLVIAEELRELNKNLRGNKYTITVQEAL